MSNTSALRRTRPQSDEQLFSRYAREGDERAFAAIVERWQPRLQGFLFKRLKNQARAEDLCQDALRRIIRAKDDYDASRSFSTWAYTIASNLLKNEYRNASRRSETVFTDLYPDHSGGRNDPPLDLGSSDLPDPATQVCRSELREAVREALDKLDPQYGVPLRLRFIEDYTYEQISAELSAQALACGKDPVPVGTVKSRLTRGRTAVRKILLRRFAAAEIVDSLT